MSTDPVLDSLLLNLMEELEGVGAMNEELYDTEVREHMSDAIYYGFLKSVPDYQLSDDFGLYTAEANQGVKAALEKYIAGANQRASEIGLNTPNDRKDAFQNETISTENEGQFYDDFFGWWKSVQ